MKRSSTHAIELLSPVGDFSCLKAAVQNGADSVYFGASQFNARASATNFDLSQLKEAIQYAGKFDNKILIEKGIQGKEVECAVLGNEDVKASCVGEIKPADEFYSYDAKYQNENSRTIIPAEISEETSDEIRKLAVKAFKAIDGKGLSRVDFFVEDKTNKVYINEINTLPGFTKISMYPKLFEAVGIPYSALLDKLIETVWDR